MYNYVHLTHQGLYACGIKFIYRLEGSCELVSEENKKEMYRIFVGWVTLVLN